MFNRNRLLLVGLAALAVASVLASYWKIEPRRSRHGAAHDRRVDGADETAAITRRYLEIEAQRKQIDQTVWAKDMQAERHEDVIVHLWDALRARNGSFAFVTNWSFHQIELGEIIATNRLSHNITRRRLGNPARQLPWSQWVHQVQQWTEDDIRLEQSEWRHARFEAGPEGATSVFALTLHLYDPKRSERHIIRGPLRVSWQNDLRPDTAPRIRSVDASQLEWLSRTGPPLFEQALSQAIAPVKNPILIDPLILYDLNNDGLSEIIMACRNLVFWNRGQGHFESGPLTVKLNSAINAGLIADFNGDSAPDLVAADADGLLFVAGDTQGRMRSDGIRSSISSEPLLNPFAMTCGDVNGDGALDIFVAQYKLPYVAGQMPTPYYDANDGFPAFLLLNDGHGRFVDATHSSGLAQKRFRRTYSCSFVDLDDDRDLDLVVVSDFAGVDLYLNDGDGRFDDATARLVDHPHSFGMAHSLADYDSDGNIDLFVIGMNSFVAERLESLTLGPEEFPERNRMRSTIAYGNRMYFQRDRRFKQNPLSDQVARTGWSWGVTSADFDNDRDLDLYIANGHKSRQSAKDYETQFWRHDIYAATSEHDPALDMYFRATATKLYGAGYSYGGFDKNRLFMNTSEQGFVEAAFLWGGNIEADCRNVVSDDLDGDGALDLILTTFEEWPITQQRLILLRNVVGDRGNWIGFRLREFGDGFSPAGAKVHITSASGRQMRYLVAGDSYRSQHSTTAHFGLGNDCSVEKAEIHWPNGNISAIHDPEINRYHVVQID